MKVERQIIFSFSFCILIFIDFKPGVFLSTYVFHYIKKDTLITHLPNTHPQTLSQSMITKKKYIYISDNKIKFKKTVTMKKRKKQTKKTKQTNKKNHKLITKIITMITILVYNKNGRGITNVAMNKNKKIIIINK